MPIPPCPTNLSPELLDPLRQFARAWAASPLRPKIDLQTLSHWENLIYAWANASDLPLYLANTTIWNGQAVRHRSDRILVGVDRRPAYWAFSLALSGVRPSLEDIRKLVGKDLIPIAVRLSDKELSIARFRCTPHDKQQDIEAAGWKMGFLDDQFRNHLSSAVNHPIESLKTEFIYQMSPANKFLLPGWLKGLSEIAEISQEITKFIPSPQGHESLKITLHEDLDFTYNNAPEPLNGLDCDSSIMWIDGWCLETAVLDEEEDYHSIDYIEWLNWVNERSPAEDQKNDFSEGDEDDQWNLDEILTDCEEDFPLAIDENAGDNVTELPFEVEATPLEPKFEWDDYEEFNEFDPLFIYLGKNPNVEFSWEIASNVHKLDGELWAALYKSYSYYPLMIISANSTGNNRDVFIDVANLAGFRDQYFLEERLEDYLPTTARAEELFSPEKLKLSRRLAELFSGDQADLDRLAKCWEDGSGKHPDAFWVRRLYQDELRYGKSIVESAMEFARERYGVEVNAKTEDLYEKWIEAARDRDWQKFATAIHPQKLTSNDFYTKALSSSPQILPKYFEVKFERTASPVEITQLDWLASKSSSESVLYSLSKVNPAWFTMEKFVIFHSQRIRQFDLRDYFSEFEMNLPYCGHCNKKGLSIIPAANYSDTYYCSQCGERLEYTMLNIDFTEIASKYQIEIGNYEPKYQPILCCKTCGSHYEPHPDTPDFLDDENNTYQQPAIRPSDDVSFDDLWDVDPLWWDIEDE